MGGFTCCSADKEAEKLAIDIKGKVLTRKDSMMKKEPTPLDKRFKMSYFDGYGRAEPIRLMLHHAKAGFDDDRISFEEWPKVKASKFGNKPLPQVTLSNGKVLY